MGWPSMSTAFLLASLILLVATTESRTVLPRCQGSCGGVEVPYPFGIGAGCFRPGFEIACDTTAGAGTVPLIFNTSIRVVNLSVLPPESQVMLPVGSQCYKATSVLRGKKEARMDMAPDAVYRISNKRNMLVVLGCITVGMMQGSNDGRDGVSGCVSYCSANESVQDGVCNGVGCCHADIQPELTGFYFAFMNLKHSRVIKYSPCDYAFLVDRNNYTFRRTDLYMDRNRTSPVWLDWAIRDQNSMPCAQVKTRAAYACVSDHSGCVNSTNGPGYVCICTKGYEGNPYLHNGCTDIPECDRPDEYGCYGVCEDTQGDYSCECRPGYHSNNPRTERCTAYFPLAAQLAIDFDVSEGDDLFDQQDPQCFEEDGSKKLDAQSSYEPSLP